MRHVNDNLTDIVRIDNELRELVNAPVISINSPSISRFRQLKDERRGYVRAIQNYKPRETV